MARETILIVEDDGILAINLQDTLTGLGYTALKPVSTGREAVKAAASLHPDLVLMDIELPGDMDGVEAAERIRSSTDIPVIFLTGYSQNHFLRQAKTAAPYGYLIKPVPERELAAAVEISLYRSDLDRRVRESERRYHQLFESMLSGSALHEIILDQNGAPVDYRFLEANPAFEQLTGLSAADIAGRTVLEVLPETEPFWIETYGRVALTGEPVRFEHFHAGLGKHFEVTAYSPATGRFATIFQDITERKQAEEALQRREWVLAQAGRMAHLGAWEVEYSDYDDLDRNPLRWSAEVYRIFGYEPGTVETTNDLFFERVHPDDRAMVRDTVAKAMGDHRPYHIEHRIVRPDGEERIVLEHAEFEFDDQGRPLRMVGAVQDITGRRRDEEALRKANDLLRAQSEELQTANEELASQAVELREQAEELRESEEKFRSLAESSGDYIMRYDRDGRHTYMNRAGLRVSGLTESDIIGKSHREAGFPEDLCELWENRINDVFETGKPARIEFEWKGAEGLVTLDLLFTPEFDERGLVRTVMGVSRDITANKQTEKNLRENRAELARAQAVAQTGSWRQDVRNNVLHWSAETYRIFGIPEGTPMISESFFEMVHPEDREWVQRAWGAALRGEPYDIEHRIVVNGAVKWVREVSELEFDQNGSLLGGFGIVQDITGRKRDEETLRKSEERLRLAMEAANDGLWDWDLRTGAVYWSPRAYTVLGYAPDEFPVDYTVWQGLIHPEDQARASASVQEQMRVEGGSFRVEFRMRNRENGWQWIIGRGKPVEWDAEGTVTRMIGTHVDITERKQAEEALRKSERSYRELFEKTPIGIFQTTSDGRVITVNPAMAEILGFSSPGEAIARYSNLSRQLWVDPSRRTEFIRQLRESGSVEGFEYEARRSDGRCIWISMNARISGKGEEGSFTIDGFSVDITERKRAEEARRESEERFRAISETSHNAIGILDENARFVWFNDRMMEISGYSREQFLGAESFVTFLAPESVEFVASNFRKFLAGEDFVRHYHFRFVRADGKTRLAVKYMAGFTDQRGKRNLIVSMLDVTEQNRAQEALRESEERFRTAFRVSPDSININRLSDGMYVDINEGFTRIMGYTREDCIGASSLDLDIWADPEDRKRLVTGLTRDGSVHNLEARFRRKDGVVVTGLMSASVISLNGEPHILSITRDITDRSRSEEALRESEVKYRTVADFTYDWEMWRRPDGSYAYISPSCERISGYSAEEFLADPEFFFSIVHPEDRERVRDHLRVEMEQELEFFTYDFRIITLDGEERWLNHFCLPVYGEDGNWLGRRASNRDITDRKRAEADLRASETRWRSYVENAPYGIFIADETGRYRQVNPAASSITGYSEAELLTMRIPDLTPPEWQKASGESFARLKSTGYTNIEIPFITKSGEMRLWSVAAVKLSPERFLGYVSDTTDRRRAEEEVKTREAFLRKIFEILPVGLWFTDKTGTLVEGNPAGVRIWGAEPHVHPSEYGVFKARRLPSGEEIAPEDWALAHTVREKATILDELLEIDAFDGKKRVILNSTAPVLDDSGEFQGAIVVNQDITEIRRLEQQFLQSQKMETIGRLAGGIAHDFNNILTVINATSEMSLMFLPPDDTSREAFEEIRKAGDRAAALTSQILAFSRRQIIEPKVICLNRILMNMDKMLRRLIGEHIELITIPTENLWSSLVDPGQIEQVLTNLAVNARDAMPEGGKLTIETRNVELDSEYAENHPETLPGPYVMMAVSDTGAGMTEEVRARAFEPFFTTKPKGSGTGLGLATCYGIVKQNNGGIWIYSEPGRGTTIKVYLPALSSEAENGEARDSEFTRGTETVLLVEDDPGIRRLVARILDTAGYQVHTASNGSEALALVGSQEGPFHLLLTDVVMPLMGGRELAGTLQGLFPGIRVLFMSGYTDNSIVHHGILEEGIMFLQKPFSPGALLRKVRETLEKEE